MKFNIFTSRSYEKRPWFDIVFEWEDDLNKCLSLDFTYEPRLFKRRWLSFLPFAYRISLCDNYKKDEYSLYFEMKANVFHFQKNIKRLIPLIIDWYVNERYLWLYKFMYSRHKFILISSMEVYEYLKTKGWAEHVYHWGLSLSDRYQITENTHFDKKYDVVIIGRQNPVLKEFLLRYKEKHPSVTIYQPKPEEKDTRDKYMQALSLARASLYATPGTDDTANRTKGFSQVTPRFLEILASGCHPIARYRRNSDTIYYELDSFCPSIETYEEFEERMDKALSTPVDMKKYSDFLSKHYTSVRAKQLQEIINNFE